LRKFDGQLAEKAVGFDWYASKSSVQSEVLHMSEITREEMRERLGNIDQIREIIVGSQMRDYNHRLEQLESNMSMVQQEMRDRLDEVKGLAATELRGAIESLEKKLKSLNLNTQEELMDVRQQIERTKVKLSKTIESLDESLDNQTKSLREQLIENRESSQEDIHNLREQVFEEIDRRFSSLKEVKVARDDMAEILFEIGMRLKGTEFAPELREVAETQMSADLLLPQQPNNDGED
jgi:predicted  nucleic acid-binding Zn-ribbon protein